MHRHWKPSVFDIEGTWVTDPQRIARLLIPIALCYALCGLEGMREQGQANYLPVPSGVDALYSSVVCGGREPSAPIF